MRQNYGGLKVTKLKENILKTISIIYLMGNLLSMSLND